MVIKKRRTNAPYFEVPTPFHPVYGKRRSLRWDPTPVRITTMRIASIGDDYLVCEGWCPDHHVYMSDVPVAKPYLLRVDPEGAIRYPTATGTPTAVSTGVRDVLYEGGGGDDIQQRELIDPPYFVGELIVAARMEGLVGEQVLKQVMTGGNWSQPDELYLPDDMPFEGVEDDDEKVVYWMDLNVAGRRWRASPVIRFEMTEALAVGESAQVNMRIWNGSIWAEDPAESIYTVHDMQHRFSKMATTSGDVGAYGWAQYMPDKDTWEIISMQIPGPFWGTLVDDLTTSDASQTVHYAIGDILRDYNVFGLNYIAAVDDPHITAYNPEANKTDFWWAGDEGDFCYCQWDVEEAKYMIMMMEPRAGEHTVDVVTDVNFVGSTVTKKRITLPGWIPTPPVV